MDAILKYWPMIGTFVAVGANGVMLWVAWSLRQFAKNEVERIVKEAVTALRQSDLHTDQAVDAIESRVTRMEGAIETLRGDIGDLPTKADLARVEGEIKVVGQAVDAAANGIGRLEGYFLTKGVDRA